MKKVSGVGLANVMQIKLFLDQGLILSDILLRATKVTGASFPTTNVKSRLSDVTACKITFATSVTDREVNSFLEEIV
jgi:hypothetical protein